MIEKSGDAAGRGDYHARAEYQAHLGSHSSSTWTEEEKEAKKRTLMKNPNITDSHALPFWQEEKLNKLFMLIHLYDRR